MTTSEGQLATIRSAQLHDAFDIRIEQVPQPPLLPKHVAISPKFCGICGSDLHFYHHPEFAATLRNPHPITGRSLPVALGHEFAGVCTEIGPGCESDLKVGDKVAVMPTISDGTCASCTSGATHTCSSLGFFGINGSSGGMSDRAVIPENLVFKLPESMDCEIGALVEPIAVAWHSLTLVPDMTPTTTALIIGAGPVGCAVLLCLKARGVTQIAVSEPSPEKRKFVSQLGAAFKFDPLSSDVGAETRKAFEGAEGVDVVFECAAVGPTLITAIDCAKARGTIINLALNVTKSEIFLYPLIMKELSLKGSIAYTKQDFQEVIAAIDSGRLDPRSLITKRIKLEDVVEEGLVSLHHKDNHNCKILVDLSL